MEDGSEEYPDFFNIQNQESDGQVIITVVATENLELLLNQSSDITYALKVIDTNSAALKIYNIRIANYEDLKEEIEHEENE